jgi:hypothetical protein
VELAYRKRKVEQKFRPSFFLDNGFQNHALRYELVSSLFSPMECLIQKITLILFGQFKRKKVLFLVQLHDGLN